MALSASPDSSPPDSSDNPSGNRWFQYPIRVQPHHTDYAGVVWHGTYVTWLEEARVEALRSTGVDYAALVAIGCELPVVDLAIHYHRPLKMGMVGIVKARMRAMQGVRITWDYEIESTSEPSNSAGEQSDPQQSAKQKSAKQICVTAEVTLVPIDWQTKKIMRQLPVELKEALRKLTS